MHLRGGTFFRLGSHYESRKTNTLTECLTPKVLNRFNRLSVNNGPLFAFGNKQIFTSKELTWENPPNAYFVKDTSLLNQDNMTFWVLKASKTNNYILKCWDKFTLNQNFKIILFVKNCEIRKLLVFEITK